MATPTPCWPPPDPAWRRSACPTLPASPPATVADTLVAPYNDLGCGGGAVRRAGTDIAAVLVEPVAGNMGVVPPVPGFLQGLRALTRRIGRAPRLRRGDDRLAGAPAGRPDPLRDRARPHLRRQGGGWRAAGRRLRRSARSHGAHRPGRAGLPGRHALGQSARHGGRAWPRSTCSPATACGSGPTQWARQAAEAIEPRARREAGVPVTVQRVGTMFTPFFTAEPVRELRRRPRRPTAPPTTPSFTRCSRPVCTCPPSAFEAAFTSSVHGEAELELLRSALAAAWPR